MNNIDLNYVWTFISGLVIGGVGVYANGFLREYGKQHVQALHERRKNRKQKKDIEKIITYLKIKNETDDFTASIVEIRDKVFEKNSEIPLAYIEELLNISFQNNRNVRNYSGTDLWFYQENN